MKYKRYILALVALLTFTLVFVQLTRESTIQFEDVEIEWMKNNPIIYVGPDPTFGPIESFDETGVYRGVAADYIQWIEDHTPLEFEIIHLENWSEALKAIKEKDIDMLGAATQTPQRDEYLEFTDHFITIPNVILTRIDFEGIISFEELSGETVVVIKDYAIEDHLILEYPNITLVSVDSVEEGLSLVSLGTHNYMAVSLAQVSYYFPESGTTNLKVSGDAGLKYELSFAVRDDYELLRDILNKALDVMPRDVKNNIYNKWVNVDLYEGVSKTVFLSLMVTALVVLFIIVIILFFNHVLKLRVKEKTDDLEIELEERKRVEASLAELNEHLEDKVNKRTVELSEAFEDLKQIQEELIESEKMASLSRILMNISHNLNTPIGSSITLVSYDEMIIKKMDSNLSDSQVKSNLDLLRDSNKMIYKELLKAKSFIDQITKLSSSEFSGVKKIISVKVYLMHLLESYHQKFQNNNIEYIIKCSDSLKVFTSTQTMDNIFKHLVNNSLKHGFEDRQTGHIEIEVTCLNEECQFVYRDDGIGIDEAIAKNIFDPLFTSDMGKTNGWGLSILYNAVNFELNGKVRLNLNVEEGVEFMINFNAHLSKGGVYEIH